MRLFTGESAREADRKAIVEMGIPSLILMENAGRHVAALAFEAFRPGTVVVICGKGNNGGDGLVAARHLRNWGVDTVAWLVGAKADDLSGDPMMNLQAARGCAVPVFELADASDEDALERLKRDLGRAGLVVDALLGTGFRGELSGTLARVTCLINDSKAPVVGVDIPSGVEAETGRASEGAVRCRLTVTFNGMKAGHVLLPGASLCGDVLAVDISIPPAASAAGGAMEVVCGWEVGESLMGLRRGPSAHKGSAGHVLVVAGSKGFAGAAELAARGALAAGAGLVTLGVPRGLQDVVATKLTEAMTLGLPEGDDGRLGCGAARAILEAASRMKALAMGPGLGQSDEMAEEVRTVVAECPVPMVLDADALNVLSRGQPLVSRRCTELVMTPHPGEMARLLGITTSEVQADRIGAARRLAVMWNAAVVLKGARTVIASAPSSGSPPRVAVCPAGNPGMASGGMGDVLTGILAALLAQTGSAWQAATMGVYLHALAGDIAHFEKKADCPGVLATDVVRLLPRAFLRAARAAREVLSRTGGDAGVHRGEGYGGGNRYQRSSRELAADGERLPGWVRSAGLDWYAERTVTGSLMWQLPLVRRPG